MELLSTEIDDVRLKCEHCGAHRVLSETVYRRATRRGIGVRCDTCTLVTVPGAEGVAPRPSPDAVTQESAPARPQRRERSDFAIAS